MANQEEQQQLFERGIFWLKRNDFEVALNNLLDCYLGDYKKEQIIEAIMEYCYTPHKTHYEQNYNMNISLLRQYPYIYRKDFPSFDMLDYSFMKYSDTDYLVYNRKLEKISFRFDTTRKLDLSQCLVNDVNLIANELRVSNILECEMITRDSNAFLWAKTPLYLYYENFDEFTAYLQVIDLNEVLLSERVVFLFGMDGVKEFFSENQATYPERVLNSSNSKDLVEFLLGKNESIGQEIIRLREAIKDYYGSHWPEIFGRVKARKPRILFHTSRFTTALQYHARDCAAACDALGIPNEVLIEKTNIHRINSLAYVQALHDFKPDIIFNIDHLRNQYSDTPENVIYVSWIQDILENITSAETASSMGPRDFILNAFFSNKKYLLDIGYPDVSIIDGPLVANPYIYKKYNPDTEKEHSQCDICVFSNSGNPKKGLEKFLSLISDMQPFNTLKSVFSTAYLNMYEAFYKEEFIFSLEDYTEFIARYFNLHGITGAKEAFQDLATFWRDEVGWRIFRSVPLEWLHERSYDMKIWGKEWLDHPILSPYAQGVAENGEPLSRIINSSKIIIGTSPLVTTHPRVFETILSNSFYLAYNIPEEHDWGNIRHYLLENSEIVFAYSKDDLFRKVDYYLENHEARKKVVQSAQGKIMASLTHEALIKNMLVEIGSRLEDYNEEKQHG